MSKIEGVGSLLSKLANYSAKVEQEVKEEVSFVLKEIEMNAIRNAPSGGSLIETEYGDVTQESIRGDRNWKSISQSIGTTEEKGGLAGSVFVERSAGEVAAWVEFGTGQSAAAYLSSVPDEWKATARKFYINGKGTIIAQPYLFPAYLKGQIDFIKGLKKILKDTKL